MSPTNPTEAYYTYPHTYTHTHTLQVPNRFIPHAQRSSGATTPNTGDLSGDGGGWEGIEAANIGGGDGGAAAAQGATGGGGGGSGGGGVNGGRAAGQQHVSPSSPTGVYELRVFVVLGFSYFLTGITVQLFSCKECCLVV